MTFSCDCRTVKSTNTNYLRLRKPISIASLLKERVASTAFTYNFAIETEYGKVALGYAFGSEKDITTVLGKYSFKAKKQIISIQFVVSRTTNNKYRIDVEHFVDKGYVYDYDDDFEELYFTASEKDQIFVVIEMHDEVKLTSLLSCTELGMGAHRRTRVWPKKRAQSSRRDSMHKRNFRGPGSCDQPEFKYTPWQKKVCKKFMRQSGMFIE
jgi:hypothetical protein